MKASFGIAKLEPRCRSDRESPIHDRMTRELQRKFVLFLHIKFEIPYEEISGYVALLMDISKERPMDGTNGLVPCLGGRFVDGRHQITDRVLFDHVTGSDYAVQFALLDFVVQPIRLLIDIRSRGHLPPQL